MIRFIVRRLVVTIPVLLGIVFIVFVTSRLIAGDPCRAILGERATDAVCEPFIQRYGLDKAILPGLFREDHELVVPPGGHPGVAARQPVHGVPGEPLARVTWATPSSSRVRSRSCSSSDCRPPSS